MKWREYFWRVGFYLLCSIALGLFFFWYLTTRIQLSHYENGRLVSSDLVYHLLLVRAFWSEQGAQVYTLAGQLQVLSSYVGENIQSAMPLGVSPIAFYILAPFAWIAQSNLAVASSLWMLLSVVLLAAGFIEVSRLAPCDEKKVMWSSTSVALSAVCSISFMGALMLGQGSILGAGALLLLVSQLEKDARETTRSKQLRLVLLLFLLAVKPTYLVLGVVIALAYGRLRELFVAALLFLLSLVVFSLKAGVYWPQDYLAQLRVYLSGTLPTAYNDSIHLNRMNNFVRAFQDLFAGYSEYFVSNCIWIGGVLVCFSLAMLLCRSSKSELSLMRVSISPQRLSVIVVSLFLLFSPYLGAYEDVLLLVVALGFLLGKEAKIPSAWVWSLGILLLLLLLNQSLLLLPALAIPCWLGKMYFCVEACRRTS